MNSSNDRHRHSPGGVSPRSKDFEPNLQVSLRSLRDLPVFLVNDAIDKFATEAPKTRSLRGGLEFQPTAPQPKTSTKSISSETLRHLVKSAQGTRLAEALDRSEPSLRVGLLTRPVARLIHLAAHSPQFQRNLGSVKRAGSVHWGIKSTPGARTNHSRTIRPTFQETQVKTWQKN